MAGERDKRVGGASASRRPVAGDAEGTASSAASGVASGAAASSDNAGATGIGATATRKRRRPRGSVIVIVPGMRTEKGYPLTRDELWSLGSLGLGATALFSFASAMIGYYVNVGLTMAFSQGVPDKVFGSYEASQWWSLRIAIGLYILGALVAASGGIRVMTIIRRTEHEDDD